MNKNGLLAKMVLNGDNGSTLSEYLGISRGTFSAKINETGGAEFTQKEIMMIKDKYHLTAEELDSIFFTPESV